MIDIELLIEQLTYIAYTDIAPVRRWQILHVCDYLKTLVEQEQSRSN